MDGDGQHRPSDIKKIYYFHKKRKCDVTVGCRDFDSPNFKINKFRKLSSLLVIFFINKLLGYKVNDPMSGFFIFKKNIYTINKKKFYFKGFKILLNFLYFSKDPKINQVKIKFMRRVNDKSKMNLKILYYIIEFALIFLIKKIYEK